MHLHNGVRCIGVCLKHGDRAMVVIQSGCQQDTCLTRLGKEGGGRLEVVQGGQQVSVAESGGHGQGTFSRCDTVTFSRPQHGLLTGASCGVAGKPEGGPRRLSGVTTTEIRGR